MKLLRRLTMLALLSGFGMAQSGPAPTVTFGALVTALQGKAKSLENTSGMRTGFQTFIKANRLPSNSLTYADYVKARMLFEATRDAGFWNLHWTITNLEPNSDHIWLQWKKAAPAFVSPTASAECDELSALYSFLAERMNLKGVGLFWPYPNHTVAVWVIQPSRGPAVRVVVPTTQIFLEEADFFGTHKFDPWRQKSIFPYTRRDVPDSFELPKPLADYFLAQIDRYAGASNVALQQLRYLREGVLRKHWTAEMAAVEALRYRNQAKTATEEDKAPYWNFAQDMRSGR